ncbi:MAG: DUF1217 domain-containing protein [Gemmobacter sp.]
MTYTPAIPLGGYAGWTYLKRTYDTQAKAFQASTEIRRDEDYFRAKIGGVKTAEQLVSDRRLLKVALGAYGLEGDINNKYFIRKVLEDGTLKDGALANRLADKQYRALSAGFGFGDFSVPRTQLSDFADKTLAAYRTRRFESAVGTQNNDMRLALNAERELPALAAKSGSDATKWFTAMGNTPLRQVLQTALNVPASVASLDLDRQLEIFQAKAEAVFGDQGLSQFAEPAKVDALVRRFLLQSEVSALVAGQSASGGALAVMQQVADFARSLRQTQR